MPTREQIEQVLNDLLALCAPTMPDDATLRQIIHQAVTTALNAGEPSPTTQPDRNTLVRLLQDWIPRGLIATPASVVVVKDAFLDALMAWASPRRLRREELHEILNRYDRHPDIEDAIWAWLTRGEEPKRWCDHCRYEEAIPAIKAEGWWLHSGQQALVYIPSSWDQCPVMDCHAERPRG